MISWRLWLGPHSWGHMLCAQGRGTGGTDGSILISSLLGVCLSKCSSTSIFDLLNRAVSSVCNILILTQSVSESLKVSDTCTIHINHLWVGLRVKQNKIKLERWREVGKMDMTDEEEMLYWSCEVKGKQASTSSHLFSHSCTPTSHQDAVPGLSANVNFAGKWNVLWFSMCNHGNVLC